MVEEKVSDSGCQVLVCMHHFHPFGKVINGHDDVSMDIYKYGPTLYKINPQLAKGTNRNYGVKRVKRGPYLGGKILEIMTMLNCMDTIIK